MVTKSSSTSDHGNPRPIASGWVVVIVIVGVTLVALATRLPQEAFYAPVLASTGEGLLLLGFVDLFFRTRVLTMLNRSHPLEQMNATIEEMKRISAQTAKDMREIDDSVKLLTIEGQGRQAQRDLLAISELLDEIGGRLMKVEHILDPKAKEEHDKRREIREKLDALSRTRS